MIKLDTAMTDYSKCPCGFGDTGSDGCIFNCGDGLICDIDYNKNGLYHSLRNHYEAVKSDSARYRRW